MNHSEPRWMISVPEVHLSTSDIWPDGDEPESPTARDVVEVMKESGYIGALITDWNLVSEVEVFDQRTAQHATWERT